MIGFRKGFFFVYFTREAEHNGNTSIMTLSDAEGLDCALIRPPSVRVVSFEVQIRDWRSKLEDEGNMHSSTLGYDTMLEG